MALFCAKDVLRLLAEKSDQVLVQDLVVPEQVAKN